MEGDEIVSRETIKPFSQTIGDHPKGFKLCQFDQMALPVYIPVVLFYNKIDIAADQVKQRLKKSLSEALTVFYPFAGRIESDNTSIKFDEEHDYGAHYIEARFDSPLSTFLHQPDVEVLRQFLPIEVESPKATTTPLLLVQLGFFPCGGMAIGLCMSHKLADLVTLCTFIRVWTSMALGHAHTQLPIVDFETASSHFPPTDHATVPEPPPMALNWPAKCVTKRFVFDGLNIAALKAEAVSETVQRPSRVEVVSALLWRCASRSSLSKHSIMVQFVNIRKRVESPSLENTMGNLVHYFGTDIEGIDKMELKEVVARLRKRIVEAGDNLTKALGMGTPLEMIDDEYKKEMRNKYGSKLLDIKLYLCSSWCNLRLYDHADFGWGKPIYLFTAGSSKKNFFRLMDTKDGDGVEAWVSLSEDEMALLERDPELLKFASFNPSALES
ncbi:stemmadenine O-acetyltransferase [Ziziphus jujuba]|uniref:Stemmadenine O-acetyltransferase n=2 Tax=Ziziphus jujuba TaxID=326968 RepID=A0A6P3ZP11_ZIZJJ|nr:stemmadenine O-acetyltransferase [Ziziphus jujuba]KAH7532933.1 hypothetical protein FEM48_Zijuj04G0075300 [Ziziphus jujuba var. spinosa]